MGYGSVAQCWPSTSKHLASTPQHWKTNTKTKNKQERGGKEAQRVERDFGVERLKPMKINTGKAIHEWEQHKKAAKRASRERDARESRVRC